MASTLRELPIAERIQIVEELWGSIADDQDALSLTEDQRAELDRRIDAYETDGVKGRPAGDVIADIRRHL